MTDPAADQELRERFQRLRADAEAEPAPDFRAMVGRAREEARALRSRRRRVARRFAWGGGLAGTAVAAALAAVLLTGRDRPDPDAEFERLVSDYASDAGSWRSPTDALLDVPGSGLVRSLPTVGETLGEGL